MLDKDIVILVGWVGTIIAFAFLFGRRLQKLESADEQLSSAIAALTVTVNELGKTRLTANESTTHLHEVRIARLEETRATTNEKLSALGDQLSEVSAALHAVSNMVARLDQQLGDIKIRLSHRPGGDA